MLRASASGSKSKFSFRQSRQTWQAASKHAEANGGRTLGRTLITAGALVCASVAVAAAAQTPTKKLPFSARLEQARSVLQVDAGGLHGAGAVVIADAVTKARYVLIGEDHLSREIPLFATSICRLMAPGGLRAFAVETGPEAARIVNQNLRRPDRIERIGAFMQAHPDAMAFQNGRDESDMAAQCAGFAGPRFEVWGLDQEFFGAQGFLLEQMLAARPGPAARVAIERLAVLDRAATAAAVASGSVGELLIFKVTDEQMADAAAAVKRDGGKRVTELFDSLAQTRAIYLGQNTDGYASNGQRARLMKRTLMERFGTSPEPARVLFKFGDVHAAKGVNALDQRDLGNFVAERAEGEGATSLHIAVYGAKGVHALYAGVGRQVRTEPFAMTDDADYAWLKDALSLRDKAGASAQWMLVDLRTLRARPLADLPPAWRKKIYEYDMLVVAPELTPSTLIKAQ